MSNLIHSFLAFLSLGLIVFACILFTNAVEFLGNKMKLGNSATGSVLAVFGTGLPETIVPIIALVGVYFSDIKVEVAQGIALGAVLGSPFMLGTLSLFVLGIVLLFKNRSQKVLYVDYSNVLRDFKYFLGAYFVAILFSFEFFRNFKFIAPIVLIVLYVVYVYRTIIKSRSTCIECECKELYFERLAKIPQKYMLIIQLVLSLLLLSCFSHIFVNEIKYFSILLGVSPVILALLVTPFATELPECVNSVIWLRQNKDDLAIANIVGAMAFQSMIPFSIGIAFTSWMFDKFVLYNVLLLTLSSILFALVLKFKQKITLLMLLTCGLFYFLFFIFLLK